MSNPLGADRKNTVNGLLDVKSRLLRGGAWVTAGKAAALVGSMATNVLLARLLRPSEVGIYFLLVTVTAAVSALVTLGLPVSVVQVTGDALGRGDEGRARRSIVLSLTLGAAGAAVGAIALSTGPGQLLARHVFRSVAMASIMPFAALWLFVSGMLALVAESFRGLHDIRSATLFSGVVMHASTAIPFALVWYLDLSGLTLERVLALMIVCGAGWTILGVLLLLRRLSPQPPIADLDWTDLLKTSAPLWISMIMLTIVSSADLWIVGAFLSAQDVAVYGAASRLAGWIATPLTLVNAVIPSMIAAMYARGHRRELQAVLQGTAAAAALPVFAMMIVVAFFGGDVLAVLFGEPYRVGASVAVLLTCAQFASVFAGSCAITLMMTGRQQMAMTATALSSAFMVTLAFLLIDRHGATGVAVAAASGQALQNAIMWWMARRSASLDTHASIMQLARLIRAR